MSSSLAFNPRVRIPTSGWLIDAKRRFTSELGLEFHVYVIKTLITLKNFSLFEFMIGVLCCNLLMKQPSFFFEGKVVPQHCLYLDFNHEVKKFDTVLVSNFVVVKLLVYDVNSFF